MRKRVSVIALICVCIKQVVCFSCYISENQASATTGVFNRVHKIKDCSLQREVLQLPSLTFNSSDTLNCFKIVGQDPTGYVKDIKGCVKRGECNNVINNINTTGDQNGKYFLPGVKCHECENENCNFANTATASIFSFLTMLYLHILL